MGKDNNSNKEETIYVGQDKGNTAKGFVQSIIAAAAAFVAVYEIFLKAIVEAGIGITKNVVTGRINQGGNRQEEQSFFGNIAAENAQKGYKNLTGSSSIGLKISDSSNVHTNSTSPQHPNATTLTQRDAKGKGDEGMLL